MAKDMPFRVRFGAVDKISDPIDRISKKFPKLSRQIQKTQFAMKAMNQSTRKLGNNLKKFGSGTVDIGRNLSLGVTAPIGAIGLAAFNANKNFQQAFNAVEAKAQESGKTFKELQDLARLLGSTTQFSATQAADAMAFLAQAGFKTNQIFDATPAVLDLAAASGEELAFTADILSNTMGAFNIKASESARVADVMAVTLGSSNVNLEQFADTMKFVAPVASQFGADIEETSAAIGFLGNIGLQGSVAATGLRTAFLNLSAPTTEASKILKGLGIQVADTEGNMKSITDIFQQLGTTMGELPQQARLKVLNAVFGKRGIAGASELMKQTIQGNNNELAKFAERLRNSEGASKRMAKIMQKGLPGAIKQMQSAFEGLLLKMGFEGGFNGMAEKLIGKVTEIIRWFSDLDPFVLQMMMGFAALAAAVGPLLVAFGLMITLLGQTITAFATISAIFAANKIALLGFSAVVIKFLVIAAGLAAIAYTIYDNWKPIKEFFKTLFTDPIEAGKQFIDLLKEIANYAASFLGINIFGDSPEDVDKKLEKQGFKIRSAESELGASRNVRELNQQISEEKKSRETNARVSMDFSNVPLGTKTQVSGDTDNLDMKLGMAGAAL